VPPYLFPDDLSAWIAKLTAWTNEVLDAAKKINRAEAEWFATLDAVPPPRVQIPNPRLGSKEDRAVYISAFAQHDFRLAKLEKFLVKHGVGLRRAVTPEGMVPAA